MKKLLSVILILVMLLSMVSCTAGQAGQNNGGTDGGTADGNGDGTDSGSNNGGSTGSGDNNSGTGNNGGSTGSGNNNGGSGDTGSGDTGSGDTGSGGNNDTPDDPPSPVYPADELEAYNALFNPENHVSLKLDISNDELKKIQKDYENYRSFGSKSPIYRMADLYVTITLPDGSKLEYVIDQVGVRMKGNTSRTDFYSDNDGMYKLVHFKISFGETFDEAEYYGDDALVWADNDARKARKNRTFATLEKIDIRWNRNDDPTYIRETYAYDLYREFGVLAPHTTLASVDIGKDHAGVFLLYEPIDKIFLEKNLPEYALGGDLYKLGWTYEGATFTSFHSYGVEDEDAGKFYIYDLKTNKKTSDHSSLKNLINTLNSSLTKDKFTSVVDLNNFMYFCAVSYMVGNPDDLRNNYNNCYLYFRKDNGKAIFIPYDLDRGLGVNTWNPYRNGLTTDSPYQNYNVNGDQRNPLFKKTVCDGGMFISEYNSALADVSSSEMLTNDRFKESFELAKSLYSGDTSPSKSYHNANNYFFGFDINKTASASDESNMSFADYIRAKKATLAGYLNNQGNSGSGDSGNNDNNDNNENDDNLEIDTPDPITDCTAYIRSDFTNWGNDENYRMTDNGNGIFTYTLSRNDNFRFKIYNDRTGKWYGTERISEDCTVEYTEDSKTNINLRSGTYLITFDTNTVTIMIEKIN